jgi:hypothetical protein
MNKSFDDFVNQQLEISQSEKSVDWTLQLKEWNDYIQKLYNDVLVYLSEYIERGKINISYDRKEMSEEFIGSYDVLVMKIAIGDKCVYLDPIGTILIGTKGRVDMIGPRGVVRFILVDKDSHAIKVTVRTLIDGKTVGEENGDKNIAVDWTWKTLEPPPKVKFVEITKETFYTSLMDVING